MELLKKEVIKLYLKNILKKCFVVVCLNESDI